MATATTNNGTGPKNIEDTREEAISKQPSTEGKIDRGSSSGSGGLQLKIKLAEAKGYISHRVGKRLMKLSKKGVVSDQTIVEYVQPAGADSKAVDQMGLDVLCGFRKKLFMMMILQCSVVLLIAWGINKIPAVREMEILYDFWGNPGSEKFIRDGAIVLVLWLLSMATLGIAAAVRRIHPYNLVTLGVFTIMISITLAAAAGPKVHLGMGVVAGGFCMTGILSSFHRGKGQIIEVFPVSLFSMVICNICILGWHFMFNTFIWYGFVIMLTIANSVGLCWAGYQIDRLGSRLHVDEFLQPLIMLWSEILVFMSIAFMVGFAVADGNCDGCGDMGCGDGCNTFAYTYWGCDCYIYADGSHGSDKHRRKGTDQEAASDVAATGGQDTEKQTAPLPQTMPAAKPEDVV